MPSCMHSTHLLILGRIVHDLDGCRRAVLLRLLRAQHAPALVLACAHLCFVRLFVLIWILPHLGSVSH